MLANYTREWTNRRCRRAYQAGRTAMYYWHYRQSWERFKVERWEWFLKSLGTPIIPEGTSVTMMIVEK